MLRLTAKDDWQHVEFYFRNNEDCAKFKYVFEDHWCNIDWNPVEHISDTDVDKLSQFHRDSLSEDPKSRAEQALQWAFNSYMKQHPERDMTAAQSSFIDAIVDSIFGG